MDTISEMGPINIFDLLFMPFTLSHPATVVPLAKNRYFVFSALVIGSMMPDVESFLHLSTDVTFAHSPAGIVLFCLPGGLLLFWIFHRVLKFPLLSLCPYSHQQRLLPLAIKSQHHSTPQWASIMLSLGLGALTHIVWDSFTHEYGWGVQHFPLLHQPLFFGLRTYSFLQHSGTLIGAILLLSWYWQWYASPSRELAEPAHLLSTTKQMGILGILLGISGLLAGFYAGAGLSVPPTFDAVWAYQVLKHVVLFGGVALFVACLLFSAYWHWSRRSA